ncbi:hypothetical protein [Tsukamurella tyrosinosolvens]|uniref:hypothetical protein n=1 Tax=Tsukamurella tyrosinosolvens TaxID=57704 RepID=UPI0015F140CE|nr:hypothetical protein [Tsukamurella tyrosinosolvens]
MHIAWPGTPTAYVRVASEHPGEALAGELDRDPTFGGVLRYGTRTTEFPASFEAGEGPWAQTTDTGVIMVSTSYFGAESQLAELARTTRSPITVFLCGETTGFFALNYYADGQLLRSVEEGPAGDHESGLPLPYELEIARSWWGENFHGYERYTSIFAQTARCDLNILTATTSTQVLESPLT